MRKIFLQVFTSERNPKTEQGYMTNYGKKTFDPAEGGYWFCTDGEVEWWLEEIILTDDIAIDKEAQMWKTCFNAELKVNEAKEKQVVGWKNLYESLRARDNQETMAVEFSQWLGAEGWAYSDDVFCPLSVCKHSRNKNSKIVIQGFYFQNRNN